ncbi:MAG: ATP-binding protein [Candidatus Omnitrophica bacterium]|nr:ATP-binding protein [Candidatus Omnitrophota bacterium]MBU1995976.1 ATP-binding protein [Candidatus Omnitrophota bacterium]MBU4334110.1 ATP-binding protein [Candidatus Omnitrophota bacterium]
MYIKRLIEKSLKDSIETFPVVLITGPRQSGKTTLVQQVLGKKYQYVSLDELDVRSLAIEDPRAFLRQYAAPVIIDEIQNAPELLSYIKALVDKNRSPGQWILTGSQQFPLMRNVSESLAGRVAVLTLYPFALDEMTKRLRPKLDQAIDYIGFLMRAKMISNKVLPIGKWLLEGGYPEIIVNKKIIKKIWFSSYLQTYIDRDVRGNIKTANLNDFERFVKVLASRTSQELNYSTLSREIGVTVPTIKSWVSFLEASSLIYLLYPYHKNLGKRVIKSPKCYFMDTGLVSFLVGLQDESHLLQGPMAGALFETACIMHFVKRFSALMDTCFLYFYRSVDGHEVDLLIETAEGIFPIEMKLSSTLTVKHTSGVESWLKLSDQKQGRGMIVSTSERSGLLSSNISNCHYSLL